jgi:hypothetical protein
MTYEELKAIVNDMTPEQLKMQVISLSEDCFCIVELAGMSDGVPFFIPVYDRGQPDG